MSDPETFDLLIVGGGVNGAGIARDAAGRGLHVALCEQADLAQYTSSASTKLIHGGLRYLEHYEFALVRKALRERERLLGIAPHIIEPMRFVLPHVHDLRPYWLLRAGLLLYDALGGWSSLPRSAGLDLQHHPAGAPLDASLRKGLAYSDCWVQDARLVVLNAVDAAERGARIWPRTRCVAAERDAGSWRVRLRSSSDASEWTVRARALVNAGGPWANDVRDNVTGGGGGDGVKRVKGSHIVVDRVVSHDFAYIFQHTDGRVIFAIPYEGDYTLVGTTDVPYDDDPATAAISAEEIDYLCGAVNRYLARPVHPEDVVSSYAGVRALFDTADKGDSASISRDYGLQLDTEGAALLHVLGGKLTTYRYLAREVLDRLIPIVGGSARDWTGDQALPGGDLGEPFEAFIERIGADYPGLSRPLLHRLARHYGRRIYTILGTAREPDDLGRCLGADLHEAELEYLVTHEWAHSADDVLWRRTKLGLHMSAEAYAVVDEWLTERLR